MKSFRLLFAGVFLLVTGFLVRGLFLPSDWSVSKSIRIEATQARIHAEFNSLPQWESWAVWFQHDPEMHRHYSDPDAGEGSSVTWQGNRSVGQGTIRIESTQPHSALHYSQNMNNGRFRAAGRIDLNPVEEGTHVTWTLTGSLGKDPFARYHRKMLEQSVSATLTSCLQNLKVLMEAGPKPGSNQQKQPPLER